MKTPASSQPGEPWQDDPSQTTSSRWQQMPPDLDEEDSFPGYAPPFVDGSASHSLSPLPGSATDLTPAPYPRRQRRLARIVAPLVALALLAGIVVVLRLPDNTVQPIISQPGVSTNATNQPAAGGNIQAYIVGAVVHPGVYPLQNSDRVDKLLEEAGGPLPDADLVRVNLAAHVTDGEEVYVPKVGEPLPSGLSNGGPGKVNINTASAEDMHTLLGISLTTANKIVAYREAHGPFTAITQLLNVMSRTTYDKIRDYITV